MATLGSTSHISDTAQATSGTTNSQVATQFTMSSGGGTITHVAVWMAGYGGSCSSRTALWNSSGTSLKESSTYTATSRTFSNGNSDLYNRALTSVYVMGSGTSFRAGWCRTSSSDGFQWDRNDGPGNTYLGSGLTGSMTSVSTDTSRKPNVYITYETVPELYVRRSGSWVRVTDVSVRRSGSWSSLGPELYVRRSGSWVKV